MLLAAGPVLLARSAHWMITAVAIAVVATMMLVVDLCLPGSPADSTSFNDPLIDGDALAHPNGAVGDLYFYFFALAHHELIDRVIDGLFQQHIDAIFRVGAVAEAADVHPGAEADVLEGREGLDAGFSVVGRHGMGKKEGSKCALASVIARGSLTGDRRGHDHGVARILPKSPHRQPEGEQGDARA